MHPKWTYINKSNLQKSKINNIITTNNKQTQQKNSGMKTVKNQNNIKFETPSWNQIYNLLLKLAKKIQESDFSPDVIVGVSRGGWIPARILSDLLGNKNLASVATEFYEDIGATKQKPTITQPVSVCVKNKKVLVVDDLADSGKSLELVKSHLTEKGAFEVRIASIYYKPWSVTVPDFYEKSTTKWVVFPWEQKETVRKIVSKTENVEDVKEKLIRFGLNKKRVEQFIKEASEEKQ
jgi:hypoxanthine phosphoribosyltransferase